MITQEMKNSLVNKDFEKLKKELIEYESSNKDKNGKINSKDFKEIQLIFICRDFDFLKNALQFFDINQKDENGNNILHYYLTNYNDFKEDYNYKLLIDIFIDIGLDINEKQSKGKFQRSPLHIATFSKQKEIFDYLIDLNADINSTDANGNTILSTAISRFNFGENGGYFIEKLIELGADINLENNHGISAKTWALRYNKNEDARKYIPESLLQ